MRVAFFIDLSDRWDNGGHRNGPGGALTPLFRGLDDQPAKEVIAVADILPPPATDAKPAIPNEPARLNECVAELLVQLRKREGR